DLSRHMEKSGEDLRYTDPVSGEKFIPHVIEPTFGIDRMLLVSLLEAYHEEDVPAVAPAGAEEGAPTSEEERSTSAKATADEAEKRIVMKFPKHLAPIKVAVLPLSKKEELASVAKPLAAELRKHWVIDYDETQSIGKRYRRQDEIGTPFCVTVDFDSLTDKKVTVRERDTMKQERVAIAELREYLEEKLD
ncbi:MAG: His/Gly/Thr/Pro-type tRNA ligase C-terminal domain-containing protein, partial [Patescibacteria group bacterium]